MVRLVLRLEFPDRFGLGRGKIELLEQIRATGSISAAGRAMGMSYRRAWLLADSMNQAFGTPVVETAQGGERGGGAKLSALGEALIDRFRRMEALAGTALAADLAALDKAVGSVAAKARAPRRPSGGSPPPAAKRRSRRPA
ncbi:MAG: LysR family transcriptional regulator [Rhodospirillales bacterium]|nr:LysR family transcriptional regulator [Rhodospirillales bacterium]